MDGDWGSGDRGLTKRIKGENAGGAGIGNSRHARADTDIIGSQAKIAQGVTNMGMDIHPSRRQKGSF